jgi:spermidine synthase
VGRQREARITQRVDLGTAALVTDPYRPHAFLLLVDGAPQSHVDLDDPTNLEFEYVRRIAAAVDLAAPAEAPLRVLHLGGGGLTLARYIGCTRPGSRQRVVERDAALMELVRRELPWPPDPRLRVRAGDARTAIDTARPDSYDVVIADVFAGARTPASLTSVEFVRAVDRVLSRGGRLCANLTDGPPLRHAKARIASIASVFPYVCVVADASVLRGRRFGNLVVTAARVPLPIGALARKAAGDWFPGRLLTGDELDRFLGGVPVVEDASATPSAPPPTGLFECRTRVE